MSSASSLDLPSFLHRLQPCIDPDTRLLICCRSEYRYALSANRSQITSHLRDKHLVPEDLREDLIRRLRLLPYESADPDTARCRDDDSRKHARLQEHEGFACRKCSYRTTSSQCDL